MTRKHVLLHCPLYLSVCYMLLIMGLILSDYEVRVYKESHYAVGQVADIEQSLVHPVLLLQVYGYKIGDNVERRQLYNIYMLSDSSFSDYVTM